MRQADLEVEGNLAVQGMQNAVNSKYLDDLSFSGDPLNAVLGLGAKDHSTNFLKGSSCI